MHNTLSRVSNVFSFFTTVVTVIACVIAIVHLVSTPIPKLKDGALKLNNVQVVKGRPHYYSNKKEEFAHIKFDLDIDLTTLFTWNTKQIFLYITATYPTSSSDSHLSQAIIWDAILPHPLSPAHHNQYIYPETSSKSKPAKSKRSPSKSSDGKQKPKMNPTPGILRLEGQRPKYQITDPSGKIAERENATLELNINIQPWVGALTWFSAASVGGSGAWLMGLEKYISTWNEVTSLGAVASPFGFPPLKDRSEAAKEAGKQGLGTERGGEANRGSPA